MHAPKWTLRVKTRESVETSLGETLYSFNNLSNCPAKDHQILGKLIEDLEDTDMDMEVRAALDRLTNPTNMSITLPQISQVRGKWKWRLPKAVSECLVGYVFQKVDNNRESTTPGFKVRALIS